MPSFHRLYPPGSRERRAALLVEIASATLPLAAFFAAYHLFGGG